jgi:hypothetical protein
MAGRFPNGRFVAGVRNEILFPHRLRRLNDGMIFGVLF